MHGCMKQNTHRKIISSIFYAFSIFSQTMMSQFDAFEHLNIHLRPDGSLERYLQFPTVPPTGEVQEPGQIAVSKDVVLNADNNTWLRITRPANLPSNDSSVAKIPVLIYFHGGGWIQFSPSNSIIHERSNKLASMMPAIVVAVAYRLAPEHRLPAQYEDAVETLFWVKKQALEENGDQWLRDYADFSRCYLYGCSNGGNIVFHTAIRALDLNIEPVKIVGLIMNQPMFGGEKRTEHELKLANDDYLPLPAVDLYWELALPPGADRDHVYSNPLADGPHKDKIRRIGRCLVIGYGGDLMVDRQQGFVQMLVLKGVPVEAKFDDIGFHGIDLIDPRRDAAVLSMVKDFIVN